MGQSLAKQQKNIFQHFHYKFVDLLKIYFYILLFAIFKKVYFLSEGENNLCMVNCIALQYKQNASYVTIAFALGYNLQKCKNIHIYQSTECSGKMIFPHSI